MILLPTALAPTKNARFDIPALQLKRNVQQSIRWKLKILVTFSEKESGQRESKRATGNKLKSMMFLNGHSPAIKENRANYLRSSDTFQVFWKALNETLT